MLCPFFSTLCLSLSLSPKGLGKGGDGGFSGVVVGYTEATYAGIARVVPVLANEHQRKKKSELDRSLVLVRVYSLGLDRLYIQIMVHRTFVCVR